ncbi:MAG: hypothetical protein PHW10_00785 [Candidatus Peribacteraceae bacterium]|nr:hypothetical protein [Candidatus Peribacteraceae bacterium]
MRSTYTFPRIFLLSLLLLVPGAVAFAEDIQLLMPIGEQTIAPGPDILLRYFKPILQWAIGVCGGVAVAWVVWAGFGMVTAGPDTGAYGEAKKRMVAAIVGLLALIFTGTILNTIAPQFFKLQ